MCLTGMGTLTPSALLKTLQRKADARFQIVGLDLLVLLFSSNHSARFCLSTPDRSETLSFMRSKQLLEATRQLASGLSSSYSRAATTHEPGAQHPRPSLTPKAPRSFSRCYSSEKSSECPAYAAKALSRSYPCRALGRNAKTGMKKFLVKRR